MTELAIAALVFVALHILPALKMREWIIARIGDPAYMGLFSLASVLGMAWLITAYRDAPASTPLYETGPALNWFTIAAMLIPIIFVVTGMTSRNPSSILGKDALKTPHRWNDIFAITRHPVMWAIAIWAGLHLLNRPDLTSALLFMPLVLLAIAGSMRQEIRKREKFGDAWNTFASQTSFLPFAGILSGKAKLHFRELGVWRILAAIGLWLALLAMHQPIIGISPLPI
jgi:uncharacterized membrane protein